MMAAVASATPSMMPTVTMEAPRVVTMNTGSRLWISSEEMSMNSEPNPSAQMPAGKARHAARVVLEDCGLFAGGLFILATTFFDLRNRDGSMIACRRHFSQIRSRASRRLLRLLGLTCRCSPSVRRLPFRLKGAPHLLLDLRGNLDMLLDLFGLRCGGNISTFPFISLMP